MFPHWIKSIRQWVRPWPPRNKKRRERGGQARRLAVEGLEDRVVPAPVSWINPAGGDWDTASNWSNNSVPGASDDVTISLPGNVVITHSQSVTDTVHSLTNTDTFDLTGGTLVAGSVQNSGTIVVGTGTKLATPSYVQTGGTTQLTGGTLTSSTLGELLPPETTASTFDGSNYVQVPSSPSLNPTTQMTMEAWINPSAYSVQQGIAGTWNDLSGNNRTYFLWMQDDKVAFYISHTGSDYQEVASSTSIPLDQWTNVAATFDGTTLSLYVNGVLESTLVSPGLIQTNNLPFYIGRVDGGGGNPKLFTGQISDVRVWDTALSQTDIQADMNQELTGAEAGLAGSWQLNTAANGVVLDQTTQNNGTLSSPAPTFTPVVGGVVDIQGGTLTGQGQINGNLQNAGAINLGSSVGTLVVRGNYTQTATGTLTIMVGPGEADQLDVLGTADLDGQLQVSLLNGFNPLTGQTFSYLNAAAVTGQFATTTIPPSDGVQAFQPTATGTSLGLVGSVVPLTSTVNPLPAFSPPTFTVSWSGQDNPGGSGIASYDIYVSDNGGPFVPFLLATPATSASFSGQLGNQYGFYSIATDNIGNRQPIIPTAAEAVTTVPAQVSTTTTLTSSAPSGSTYGTAVTFTAVVSPGLAVLGTPAGSVQFQVDGSNFGAAVPLAGGSASLMTTLLTAGPHLITAVYTSNSSEFLPSSGGPLSQSVTPAVLTVTADNKTKVAGASVPPLTASYSGFVNSDSAVVVGGAPALSTTATAASPAGSYAISVAKGTLTAANYTFVFVNGTLTVTPALTTKPATTTTTVTSSANPSVYAQPITFTATVTAVAPGTGTPTGSVTFFDGSTSLATVPLTGGSASLTIDTLGRGNHTIKAVYSGAAAFTASTSAALTQTVQTAALEPDPLDPSKVDLVVGGTSGDDVISITAEAHTNRIDVEVRETNGDHFTFSNTYAVAGLVRFIVYGGPGNDLITVGEDVTLPALLFAGAGDDVLIAGGGPSVLVGGAGDDLLVGGHARDILIGGGGHDVLLGTGRNNLLIGGATPYDSNVVALLSLEAEWSRPHVNRATRISQLTGATPGGLNGDYDLNAASITTDEVNILLGK